MNVPELRKSWMSVEGIVPLISSLILGCLAVFGKLPLDETTVYMSLALNSFIFSRALYKVYRGMFEWSVTTGEFRALVFQYLWGILCLSSGLGNPKIIILFMGAAQFSFNIARGITKRRFPFPRNVVTHRG